MNDTIKQHFCNAARLALPSLCCCVMALAAHAAPADWRAAAARGWLLAHAQARPAGAPTSAAAPQIVSGKILTPKVNVGAGNGTPTYRIDFNAPGYYNSNYFIFTGPSGQTVYQDYGVPPPGLKKTGSITFADLYGGFSIFSQPGTWTLTSGGITDFAGNSTTYNQTQLAALLPSLTLTIVNTGPADSTPPTVTAGKILTPTVSLSAAVPFFKAELTATDNLSGVASIGLYFNEPDGTAYPGLAFIEQNDQATSGTFTAGALLNTPGLPTGTWTISAYGVCDVAGNCLTVTDAATLKQQFGTTTFTVTP